MSASIPSTACSTCLRRRARRLLRPRRAVGLPAMLDKPAAFRRPPGLIAYLGALMGLSACWLAGLTASEVSAAETPRYYQVEVVVFAHPAGTSAELPPRPAAESLEPAGFTDSPGSRTSLDGPNDRGAVPDEAPRLPEGFRPPHEPLRLEAVAARLDTGGYDLLWHQGWVQPPDSRRGIDLPLLAALGQG